MLLIHVVRKAYSEMNTEFTIFWCISRSMWSNKRGISREGGTVMGEREGGRNCGTFLTDAVSHHQPLVMLPMFGSVRFSRVFE